MNSTRTIEPDGTLIYTWDDDVVLTVKPHQVNRRGQYPVTVLYKGKTLNTARVNLLDLKDRNDLQQHCGTLDGQIAWLERLVEVASALPDQETVEHAMSFAPALVSLEELLTLNIPERKRYMEWLPERGLVMGYGPRGAGKTMFMLGLAIGLTTGQVFLKWPIAQTTAVLYVDGEMPLAELRERTVALAQHTIPQGLFFLTGELVYERLGTDLVLTSETARKAIAEILDTNPQIKVLILDNVSCLFTGISEDKKSDWEPVNAWLVRLRHRGITVVLVHHAGKGGQQRGTSGREDSLDAVLSIEVPHDYRPEEGCHFHLRFTKSRSIKGDAVAPFDVRLAEIDDGPTWTFRPLEESARERVEQMLHDGMTPGEIVAELGVTRSYVYRIRRDTAKTQEPQQ
jgi:putative DNA primase/helicase